MDQTVSIRDEFLIPQDIINSPPTVSDGTLNFEEEEKQRSFGCGWIQKAGIILRVPIESSVHGQTILHRFYFRRSMKEFDLKITAAASLYLGCKIGETPRRIRDIIYIYYFIDWLQQKDLYINTLQIQKKKEDHVQKTSEAIAQLEQQFDVPLPESKAFRTLRINIHRVERHILRETGFVISRVLIHPHRYILQYIHSFLGDAPKQFRDKISQRAWGYLNDSQRTTLCCSVRPSVVTVTAIFLATSDFGLNLSEGTQWFHIFDVSWTEIQSVSNTIKRIYNFSSNLVYIPLANPPVPLPVSETTTETKRCTDTTSNNEPD